MLDVTPPGPVPPGHVPHLPSVGARSGDETRSARLDAILRDRDRIIDDAADESRKVLERIADELGARAVADLESRGLGDLRLAVDTVQLDEVLDLLAELGVNDAQREWFDRLRELAGLAERAAYEAGVTKDQVALDQEGLAAAIDARYKDAATWWDATIERPLAQTILDGLHDARALTTTADLANRLSERARISVPAAYGEVLTQTAIVDRFVAAEIAQDADPDGEVLRWAYIGPVDGIQRPFCQHLTGKFFKPGDLGALDNGTALPHPLYSGGGYRCRHRFVQAPAKVWERRGLTEGGPADVKAANLAAVRKVKL